MAVDLYSLLASGHGREHVDNLNPGLRDAFSAMLAAAPPELAAGFGIQSGFRSPERQAQLYQAALQKYGSEQAARKWVAPPGKSQHNHGNAIDLSYASDAARKWAHENAAQFGLAFPMAHEPWHVELQGVRGGQQAAVAPPAAGPQPQQPDQPAMQVPKMPEIPLMPPMEAQAPVARSSDPGMVVGAAGAGLEAARRNAMQPIDIATLMSLGRRPA